MLEASCGLELSESTECRNSEETKEVMTSGSKDASSSGVSMESMTMDARVCSHYYIAWY